MSNNSKHQPSCSAITASSYTLLCDLPDASLEYCRERRELLSLEIAVGMSGCDTVLSRLPLVKPHRSQRDLRSPSAALQEKNNQLHKSIIMQESAIDI